jgi:hypothetical protein
VVGNIAVLGVVNERKKVNEFLCPGEHETFKLLIFLFGL